MEKDNDTDFELLEKYRWMVNCMCILKIRPCSLYNEEYKDCKTIKSRFHQKFVHGNFIDCSHWKHDYNNCIQWTENTNKRAFKELVESEQRKRNERMQAHLENDVWEKRTEPLETWNDPLPQWIEERMKNSYLVLKAQSVKESGGTLERTNCVIS